MPRVSVVDRRLEEMSSGWKPWSISGTPTASPVMYVLVTHTRTHISWCRKNTPTVLCVTMSNKGGVGVFSRMTEVCVFKRMQESHGDSVLATSKQ